MTTTAFLLVIFIGLAIGGTLTIPALGATKYMGLAGASITLIGASIGLASGTQTAVFAGGIVALLSGLVGICLGFLLLRLGHKN